VGHVDGDGSGTGDLAASEVEGVGRVGCGDEVETGEVERVDGRAGWAEVSAWWSGVWSPRRRLGFAAVGTALSDDRRDPRRGQRSLLDVGLVRLVRAGRWSASWLVGGGAIALEVGE